MMSFLKLFTWSSELRDFATFLIAKDCACKDEQYLTARSGEASLIYESIAKNVAEILTQPAELGLEMESVRAAAALVALRRWRRITRGSTPDQSNGRRAR